MVPLVWGWHQRSLAHTLCDPARISVPSDPRSPSRPPLPCCCTSFQESFFLAVRVCQSSTQIQCVLAGCDAKGEANTGTYLLGADGCKPENRQVNSMMFVFLFLFFCHWRKGSVIFMACISKSKAIPGRRQWKISIFYWGVLGLSLIGVKIVSLENIRRK